MKANIAYGILILSTVVLGLSCTRGDKDKIAVGLKNVFQNVAQHSDSIYLADSMPRPYEFDYNELQPNARDRDSLLLKSIIDSGGRELVTAKDIQQILLPHKVRIVTRGQFDNIEMPAPILTKKEMLLRRKGFT